MKNYKKEKSKAIAIMSVGFAIGGALLITGVATLGTLVEIACIALIIVGAVFLLLGYIGFGILKKVKRSFCPKCHAQYIYNDDVEWFEADRTVGDRKVDATLDITCVCHECGHEKQFTKKVEIARIVKDSAGNEQIREHNVEHLARRLFF